MQRAHVFARGWDLNLKNERKVSGDKGNWLQEQSAFTFVQRRFKPGIGVS